MPQSKRKGIHDRSCLNCCWCWYHEEAIGETTYDGPSGWVCDGHKNPGIANLKSFPFLTEQKCFGEKR